MLAGFAVFRAPALGAHPTRGSCLMRGVMGSRANGRRTADVPRLTAFALTAAVTTYYALRGGSYDVVVRQEEAIAVWLVLGLGGAVGLLPRARLPRLALVPLGAVALLALWTALSLSWTDSDERTLAELARVVHLGGLALLALSLLDRRTWRAAAAGLALAGVIVCGVAVASRLAPDAFPVDEIRRGGFRRDRLNYPFWYWNAVAAWGAMALAMALAWSAHARSLLVRIAYAGAIPLCVLTVYLSYSRAGVAGSALAVVAVIIFGRNRWLAAVHALVGAGAAALVILVVRNHEAIAKATGDAGAGAVLLALLGGAALCALAAIITWIARADRWRVSPQVAQVGVAVAVLVLAIAAVTVASDPISRGWDEFQATEQPAPNPQSRDPAARLTTLQGNRSNIWRSARRAFDSAPFEGVGPGTFEYWWNRDKGEEYVRDAHSLYLESLGEQGIPGLVLVLVFLLGLLAVGLRARFTLREARSPGALAAPIGALVVFLLHAGVDWMWETTAVTALAILGGGIAAAASARRRPTPVFALRIAIPAVAILAILVQIPGLVSTSQVRESQASVRQDRLQEALISANDAVEAQPWAASPYVQRALVEQSTGRLEAAAVDLRRAVRREPTNWRLPLQLAVVQAERGRVRAAVRAYRRARRLRPRSPVFAAQPQP